MKKIVIAAAIFFMSVQLSFADKRITDLTAQTDAISASDLIPGVDVSDTTDNAAGSSKKITWTQVGTYLANLFQGKDTDLDDLADGSLSGSKVGTGIDGSNITSGTVAAARIDEAIARDSELVTPLATVRTTAGGGSTTAPPQEAAVGDALAGKQAALTNPLVQADIDDTPSDGNTTQPASSNSVADHIAATAAHGISGAVVGTTDTQTLTNKTFDITSAGNVVTQEFVQPVTWLTPGDTDDPIVFSEGVVRTLQGMKCICLGGGTIAVDLQECNSNATSCGTTGATFTCGATMTADSTLTDTSIASNAVMRLFVGAPSGTVDQIHCTVWGTEVR